MNADHDHPTYRAPMAFDIEGRPTVRVTGERAREINCRGAVPAAPVARGTSQPSHHFRWQRLASLAAGRATDPRQDVQDQQWGRERRTQACKAGESKASPFERGDSLHKQQRQGRGPSPRLPTAYSRLPRLSSVRRCLSSTICCLARLASSE